MNVEDVKERLDGYISVMEGQGKKLTQIVISEEQYFELSGHGKRDVPMYRNYPIIVKKSARIEP